MISMRKTNFLAIFIILIFGLTACGKSSNKEQQAQTEQVTEQTQAEQSTQNAQETANEQSENQEKKEKETPDIVLVQTAKTAILKKLSKYGYYMLTLYQTNPYAHYFTERPIRKSGILANQTIIDSWDKGDNSFYINNPNAFLTAVTIDRVQNKSSQFYLMSLSTPKYDIQTGQLSYVVKALPDKPFIFDDMQFDYVTLVIDGTKH